MNQINIILADDHSIVRDGIKSTLSSEKNLSIIGEASNGLEAVDIVKKLQPDVAILDISMPEMDGLQAVKKITSLGLPTRCLILSMHDKEEYVMEAIESGAAGYLLKDTEKEEFVRAINAISKGEKYFSTTVSSILVNGYLQKMKVGPSVVDKPGERADDSILTKREKNILKMVVEGKNNKEIAEELDISIRTIETHRGNIMKKLRVKNAVEMVKKAIEEKLV
jgi:two-component system, NarL family, response regulator DegU